MKVKLILSAIFSVIATSFFFNIPVNATQPKVNSSPLSSFAAIQVDPSRFNSSKFYSSGINAYVPTCTTSGGSNIKGSCGGDITSEGNIERTKEMVEKYGVLAMNLQITYGVSWELIITQMVAESGVGTAGAAVQIGRDNLYNWMGLSTCNINGGAKYGSGKTYARPAAESCYYEAYETIEDMMKSYASGDYLRNGLYDHAFPYTDKNNYDLKEYDKYICGTYVGGHNGPCSEDDEYITTTMGYLKYVREKASELGYPTSEELQKEKNIPIGGKFPIGSKDVYDDSVSCGETSSTSSTSSSSSSSSSNTQSNSTTTSTNSDGDCAKLAKLRQDLWDAASEEDKEYFVGVAYRENGTIALEGFFNQIIAYNISSIHDWLNGQCVAFGGGMSCTSSKHSLTDEGADEGLKSVLGGSNKLRFAIGNATGGSGVGAGKIVCVWDGEKCRDDVDYNKPDGSPCSAFTSSASEECWGMEGAPEWPEKAGVAGCSGDGTGTTETNTCPTGGCSESLSEEDFPNYLQGDPEWSNVPFYDLSGKKTCPMASCGCGPTTLAEIITIATGQPVTPRDVVEKGYGNSVGGDITKLDPEFVAKYDDLESEVLTWNSPSEGIQKLEKALKDGWMIHTHGNSNRSTGVCAPTSISFGCQGHYVSLLSIDDDGKVTHTNINDGLKAGDQKHTLQELFDMGLYPDGHTRSTGDGVAIRKKGSSGSNCDIGANGLTAEQAAKLLAWYSVNKNDDTRQTITESYWDRDSCRRNQCTAFSAFFVTKFTKQTLTGGTFSGSYAVTQAMTESGGGETSSEPLVFSLFQAPGHTGIVVGKEDDGTFIYANNNGLNCSPLIPDANAITGFNPEEYYAWNYGSWGSAPHIGIVSHDTGVGGSALYMKLDVDTKKLMDYINNGP